MTISFGSGILRVMKTKTAVKPNGNGVKVAYSYRRFSSRNPQQRDGTTLQRQFEMAQEVCTANNWQLVDLPPDASVSGFKITDADEQTAANFHKGQLGKFLAKVRAGEITVGSVLVLEQLDRFSRNYFDIVFPVWLELLQTGIEIYSCVSRTHYTLEAIRKNPMLAGMALMELANGNEYSRGLSERIGKAFKIKLADAASGKKVHLGSWQPRWIDFHGKKGEEGTFTFNDYAKTVRRIVLDYIDNKSMNRIAKALIAEKKATAQGGKWGVGIIASILRNQDAMRGTITVKGTTLNNFYEPLITDAEYNVLKAKLSENKNKKGGCGNTGSDTIANLFRNRGKCICGGSVRAGAGAYRCRDRELGKCQHKGSMWIKEIEEDFFGLFIQEQPEALLGKHTPKHNQEISRLKSLIAQLDKGIDDATHLIGKLPISQLEAKLTALVKERDTLNEQLETESHKILSANNAPNSFADIKTAILKWDKAKYGSQQEGEAMYEFNQAGMILMEQLANNDTRKKLLDLLPALVQRLEMDFTKSQYRIVNASGEVSAWREIIGMDTMLTSNQ